MTVGGLTEESSFSTLGSHRPLESQKSFSKSFRVLSWKPNDNHCNLNGFYIKSDAETKRGVYDKKYNIGRYYATTLRHRLTSVGSCSNENVPCRFTNLSKDATVILDRPQHSIRSFSSYTKLNFGARAKQNLDSLDLLQKLKVWLRTSLNFPSQHLVEAIRLTRLDVPQSIQVGQPLKLRCLYETKGDKLQSLSWYKNGKEFYRYQPFERRQPVLAFNLSGVNVDVSN